MSGTEVTGMMIDFVMKLLLMLSVKHFVIDFIMQTPYMYQNKGKLTHPGGYLHSGLHALATWLIFWWPGYGSQMGVPIGITYLCLGEFVVHFLMDYTKVRVNSKYGWESHTHNEWWWLLGFDQLVHGITYMALVWVYLSGYIRQ